MNSPATLRFALTFLAAAASAPAADFRLDDGTVLKGEVVSLDDSVAVIRTTTLGEVRMRRARVVEGLPGSDPARAAASEAASPEQGRRARDPAGYALFFMPTAFTPEAGTVTFRDFELFFLAFGFSPTNTTVFSGGFLFPISSSVQVLSFGAKQQLYSSGSSALAVTGNVTLPILEDTDDEEALYNANLVFSKRFGNTFHSDAVGLHAMAGTLSSTGETLAMLGLGSEFRLTRNAKFLAEIYGPFEEFDSALLTLGFRLHAERLSADIGGVRPLEAEGDFLFFPMLVINYRW
jgi:hypothetical protein